MELTEYTPKPNLPPKHLSYIPVEADRFINVRVTREFKERVQAFSNMMGCTVTKTVLSAIASHLGPME